MAGTDEEAGYRLRRHPGPEAFRQRVGDWLMASEAENNLVIAVVNALESGAQSSEGPPYLATIEDADGELVGCVIRTPPFKPILTRVPTVAVPAVVNDLADLYAQLPAIMGPEPEVRLFAEAWAELRGVRIEPAMEMRVHELAEVRDTTDPPGSARWAEVDDVGLVAEWIEAFGDDARVPTSDPEGKARRLVGDRALALWIDEARPVSMAGRAGRTPHGARVGPVYTPPELRGRGYATAVTAWVTRRLLETGLRRCFLYTDLANPTSNRIYRRIGYEPVMDVRDYEFIEAEREG